MRPARAAILGSGNIGTDLMFKLLRGSGHVEIAAMGGIDPASDGLDRARRLGVATTAGGAAGLLELPDFAEISLVFDATSASAHRANAAVLAGTGVRMIDLTPAASGPLIVPAVNLDEIGAEIDVNMVTCGGQATIPIVAAISAVTPVRYAEIVATIASPSAGPGTRANIDEFTETTARAIEKVGGAQRGKAIIIINPGDPPMIMRDTVMGLVDGATDHEEIRRSIEAMVARVAAYVPGYRLKRDVQFEDVSGRRGIGSFSGPYGDSGVTQVSVFLEVEGAAHYLPSYAGNLDIMTSAAVRVGEAMAEQRKEVAA